MRLTKPLIKIGEVDIADLLVVLSSLDEKMWQQNTYRQDTYAVHQRTESIVIHFETSEFVETHHQLLPLFQPLLAPIFARFAQFYGYQKIDVAKLMLAKLPAGETIPEHFDSDPMFAKFHRIHVPLVTHHDVDFLIAGQKHTMDAGVMYDLNNLAMHSVYNRSHLDRIHLIFDARPTKRIANAVSHLFIMSPNNCGSTLVSAALADTDNVISLPKEGQYLPDFAGPTPAHELSMYVWSQFNTLNRLQSQEAYNWPAIRKCWSNYAQIRGDNAAVFVEKSPCNIARMQMLIDEFDDVKMLFLIRNPFAMFESIVRGRADLHNVEHLAVAHIIWCFSQQKLNKETCTVPHLLLSYETICNYPEKSAKLINSLEPNLNEINFIKPRLVKGEQAPLVNRNNAQIACLDTRQLAFASQAFAPYANLFAYFGYNVLDKNVFG